MKKHFIMPFVLLSGCGAMMPGPTLTGDTGFASIHTWRAERGITCMIDHFHSGCRKGRTKKAALNAAIVSWEGFTALRVRFRVRALSVSKKQKLAV